MLVPGWCLMRWFEMMIMKMKMRKRKLCKSSRITDIRLINLTSDSSDFRRSNDLFIPTHRKGTHMDRRLRRKTKVSKSTMNRTLNSSCFQELSCRQKVFIFGNVQSIEFPWLRHCLYPKAESFEWFNYIHIEYLITNDLGIQS